jgi:hypothetical protein
MLYHDAGVGRKNHYFGVCGGLRGGGGCSLLHAFGGF